MPAVERFIVRRPLRFRKNMSPLLIADGVTWRVHRNGTISFPEHGEKGHRPTIPIETLAYILPMFGVPGIDFKPTPTTIFSTKPGRVPHIQPDGHHVCYRLTDRWLYLTKADFVDLLNALKGLSPKAYRDLSRLRPIVDQ